MHKANTHNNRQHDTRSPPHKRVREVSHDKADDPSQSLPSHEKGKVKVCWRSRMCARYLAIDSVTVYLAMDNVTVSYIQRLFVLKVPSAYGDCATYLSTVQFT